MCSSGGATVRLQQQKLSLQRETSLTREISSGVIKQKSVELSFYRSIQLSF